MNLNDDNDSRPPKSTDNTELHRNHFDIVQIPNTMFIINILLQKIHNLLFGISLHNENTTLLKNQISETDVKTLNGAGSSGVASLANKGPTVFRQSLE